MSDAQPIETWKGIEGFADYQVSSLGQVRSRRPRNGRGPSMKAWRLLAPIRRKDGYLWVHLSENGFRIEQAIHVLVLNAFVGPCPVGLECCHEDGSRDNNIASNLRWGTRKDNAADRTGHGRQPMPTARLTPEQVVEMQKLRKEGVSTSEIAQRFGVVVGHVPNVSAKKVWTNIDTSGCSCRRLSPEKLATVRKSSSLTITGLAAKSGVDYGFLYRLEHGRKNASWATVCKLATALGVDPDDICNVVPMDSVKTIRGRPRSEPLPVSQGWLFDN